MAGILLAKLISAMPNLLSRAMFNLFQHLALQNGKTLEYLAGNVIICYINNKWRKNDPGDK